MIRTISFFFLLLFIGLTALYIFTPAKSGETPVPENQYLDAHVHLAGIGAGGSGNFIHPDLLDSFKSFFYWRAFGVTLEEIQTYGDEILAEKLNRIVSQSKYVSRVVVLAMDGVVRNGKLDREATQIYVTNSYVAKLAKRYPHLEYGASVHPERPDWQARLHKAKQDGALLIKWLPSIMDIDPANPDYIPYYQTLVALDLPLLIHVGQERSFAHADDTLSDPAKIRLPLNNGVTVIAAHIATTGIYGNQPSFERLLPLFAQYPNLYTDISSLTQINKLGYLKRALAIPNLEARMIYGSDWPLQFFPLVSPFYHWPGIDLASAKYILSVDNVWDRDVLTKRALGVPDSVFERSAQLLGRN